MKKINQIQIGASGLASVGKSHVINLFKKALKDEYFGAPLVTDDLDIELNGNNESDLFKPLPNNKGK